MQSKTILRGLLLLVGLMASTFAESYNKTVDVLGKPVIPCQDDAQIDPHNPWDPNNWGCGNNKQNLRGGNVDPTGEPHD